MWPVCFDRGYIKYAMCVNMLDGLLGILMRLIVHYTYSSSSAALHTTHVCELLQSIIKLCCNN